MSVEGCILMKTHRLLVAQPMILWLASDNEERPSIAKATRRYTLVHTEEIHGEYHNASKNASNPASRAEQLPQEFAK